MCRRRERRRCPLPVTEPIATSPRRDHSGSNGSCFDGAGFCGAVGSAFKVEPGPVRAVLSDSDACSARCFPRGRATHGEWWER